jgi:hypothetical protein
LDIITANAKLDIVTTPDNYSYFAPVDNKEHINLDSTDGQMHLYIKTVKPVYVIAGVFNSSLTEMLMLQNDCYSLATAPLTILTTSYTECTSAPLPWSDGYLFLVISKVPFPELDWNGNDYQTIITPIQQ